MKRLSFTFIMICVAWLGFSQYYYVPYINAGVNPGSVWDGSVGGNEYPLGGGMDTSWSSILGPSIMTPTWSAVQTLPFSFDFNGNAVSQFKVSNTGCLTFDVAAATAPSGNNVALPSAQIPNNSIVIWGLDGPGANDYVVTRTFGTAPARQFWVWWSSYNYQGGAALCWTYWAIVFDETTNNIHIADLRVGGGTACIPALTVGIQIDMMNYVQVNGSPNLGNNAGASALPDDNTYYTFLQGALSVFDMSATAISMPSFVLLSAAPFDIVANLINFGSQTVTSFDLNYSVNGGTPVTMAMTASLPTYGSATFTHPAKWTPASTGNYCIDVWATNINGNNDENPGNDLINQCVQVVDIFKPRYPIVEQFTSSSCAPCAPGNVQMKAFLDANPGEWTLLRYQMSWPGNGDPYYTLPCGLDRRQYYSITGVPTSVLDGIEQFNPNEGAAGIQNRFDNRQQVPAFMEISATANIYVSQQKVDIDVRIDPVADYTSNTLTLQMAIFEYLTTRNATTNGETEFHYVMKKMVPDAFGTTLTALTGGVAVNDNGTYTFQGSYRLPPNALPSAPPINHAIEHSVEEFTDLGVLVWVQDDNTMEVHQSAFAVRSVIVGNELPTTASVGFVGLYPNPASTVALVDYMVDEPANVTVKLHNALGQVVYVNNLGNMASGKHSLKVDVSELSAGLYSLELNIGGTSVTEKLTVN